MIQDLSSSSVKKIEYKYKKIKINKILQPIRIIKTFKRPFQISAKILIIFLHIQLNILLAINVKIFRFDMKKAFTIIAIFYTFFSLQAGAEIMNKEIYFAGGCFWGAEEFFSKIPGVEKTEVGYANSIMPNPDYKQVCSGATGATETVKVTYNPEKVSLSDLVWNFFRIIDPLSVNRQGNDRGTQYRTGVYFENPNDKKIIEEIFEEEQGKYGVPLAVELLPLSSFYKAEEYHQDYLKKNPGGYCHINLDAIPFRQKPRSKNYRKPTEEEIKRNLSPMEYAVTQEGATERAFTGRHWDRHEKGIYVDIVTGEPLFSSKDKFDSGTGWASFTSSIEEDGILGRLDNSHGMKRIEARSKAGNSHLGHIFPDGPKGLRYCINDAALRFIPEKDMEKEGYGEYLEKIK